MMKTYDVTIKSLDDWKVCEKVVVYGIKAESMTEAEIKVFPVAEAVFGKIAEWEADALPSPTISSRASRVEIEINQAWASENPTLAFDTVVRFVSEHPQDEWNLSARRETYRLFLTADRRT